MCWGFFFSNQISIFYIFLTFRHRSFKASPGNWITYFLHNKMKVSFAITRPNDSEKTGASPPILLQLKSAPHQTETRHLCSQVKRILLELKLLYEWQVVTRTTQQIYMLITNSKNFIQITNTYMRNNTL